ncbi:protease B nonderepressible form [Friedmanniomyces endolithicus]|nr:protease B nonderepressible form [Friedmanniomyces endolithicus]KAK0769555.1 protease B nonderepressible form [Friedmanniomyces endolithicus]KAK0774654.1 protease B nonderepressible form [Friedmanniomyces endolithicus]KAK0827260.1 protease B nonderepressible form [Friedmanniomyces endolithicus]KAK0915047.1 protease B nonderepressible form [Friedmanniomyces endolithicus]
MKQRITYLLPEGSTLTPDDILLSENGVNVSTAEPPAIEKRVTAGLSELPTELRNVFHDIHELHIRYASRMNCEGSSPLVSRLPPGLHVFFTPRRSDSEVNICPILHTIFSPSLRCHSTSTSFSTPPILSERFAHTSSLQYFHRLPKLLHFQGWLARTFCPGVFRGPCPNEVASLSYASYIDIDFDAISHAVTLTAVWRQGITAQAARTPARLWREGDGLEVGVLVPEQPEEPEELKFGGFLTVVGEDETPGGTLFSFPSRHHPLPPSTPATFKTSFQQPTGLHPKLDMALPRQYLAPAKDDGSCALHAYLTLPSALFIDRYQLDDAALLAEHNLKALRSLSGEQDLEAPDWVVERWGSAALIELASPPLPPTNRTTLTDRRDASDWTATIPLHLRYLQAPTPPTPSPTTKAGPNNSNSSSYIDLPIPHPILFWACSAQEGLKMGTNPFDRVNLGYDGLFGSKTMFYHVPPSASTEASATGVLEEVLRVPVLDARWGAWVQVGTLLAVVVGFGWVCLGLFRGRGRGKGRGGEKSRRVRDVSEASVKKD